MEVYLKARDMPSSHTDSSINFKAEIDQANDIVLTDDLRKYVVQKNTGLYYICFYAYEASSLKLWINEYEFLDSFEIPDSTRFNMPIFAQKTFTLLYTNPNLGD